MAGNSGAIRAGRAFVELFADDTKLQMGLRSAQAKLKAWGASANAIGNKLTLFGAGALTSLVGFAKVAADSGSQIKDLADQTGLSAEAASTLKFAADQSAGSIEELAAKINKMQQTIVAANQGSHEAAHALSQIGLSAADLFGLAPDQQFKKIATAISGLALAEERTAATTAIFGKNSADLLPLLLEGGKGIDALQAKARALGVEMSGEQVAALEAFGDQWAGLKMQLSAVVAQLGGAVIPALGNLIDRIGPIVTATAVWVKANKGVIQYALAGAAAIFGLGVAFKLAAAGMAVAQTALAALSFLLTPTGLIVAGITAGVVALGAFSGAGETFKTAWGGIVEAVKAGNLEGAFKIVAAGIKLMWAQMIGYLQETWSDFSTSIKQKFLDIGEFFGANVPLLRGAVALEGRGEVQRIRDEIGALQEELRGAVAAGVPDAVKAGQQERIISGTARKGMLAGETKTAGTFSGIAAMQQLGSQSIDKQIEQNTKRTAEELRRLRKEWKPQAFL